MSKTGSQIEKDVFRLIKASKLNDAINGTIYRSGMRPKDSKKEDAVVKFLTGLTSQIQNGVVVINIYVPNIEFQGRMVKDINRCEEVEVLINGIITDIDTTEYNFSLNATPQTLPVDEIEQHFVNVRLNYKRATF